MSDVNQATFRCGSVRLYCQGCGSSRSSSAVVSKVLGRTGWRVRMLGTGVGAEGFGVWLGE